MPNITVLFGVVEKHTSAASSAITVFDTLDSDKEKYDFAVQFGQASTAIASVVEFSKPLARSVPLFSIATNSYAASLTLFKVILDVQKDKDVNMEDITSIIGNVAGIGLTIAVLASSAPAVAATFAGLSILSSAASVMNSKTAQGIGSYIVNIWKTYFKDNQSANYYSMTPNPNGTLSSSDDLAYDFNNRSLAIGIGEDGETKMDSIPVSLLDSGSYISNGGAFGGAGSGGNWSMPEGNNNPQPQTESPEDTDDARDHREDSDPIEEDDDKGNASGRTWYYDPNDSNDDGYVDLYETPMPGMISDEDADLPDARVYVEDPEFIDKALRAWKQQAQNR